MQLIDFAILVIFLFIYRINYCHSGKDLKPFLLVGGYSRSWISGLPICVRLRLAEACRVAASISRQNIWMPLNYGWIPVGRRFHIHHAPLLWEAVRDAMPSQVSHCQAYQVKNLPVAHQRSRLVIPSHQLQQEMRPQSLIFNLGAAGEQVPENLFEAVVL